MRVSKLFDLAYVIAKEELPFSKYPALVEVEKRHGVDIGTAYTTEHKCKDVLQSLKQARYILC